MLDTFEIWIDTYEDSRLFFVCVDWNYTEHDHTDEYCGYYEYEFRVISIIDELDNEYDWTANDCPITDDHILEAIDKAMEGGML